MMRRAIAAAALGAAIFQSPAAAADVALEAHAILQAAQVQGGLVVHLGCGDGRLTAALRADDRYLVQGLDASSANVETARRHVRALGLYGPVSADCCPGPRLPYVDNLVNLFVAEDLGSVPRDEVLRVLRPLGVACLKQNGAWTAITKPWPASIDEWTHFLHGPDNNAVARDTTVDVPRSVQWVAEPRWGRSHEELASMSAAVTARGRIYTVVDEAPLASIRFLGDWKLVARDAFNGTLLWKRPVAPWNDHLRHFRSGPAHLPRRLVAVGDVVYFTPGLDRPVVALDGATGRTIRTYPATERTEEILVQDGILYLAAGSSEAVRRGGGLFARGEPPATPDRCLSAVDASSGRTLWSKAFTGVDFLLPLSLTVKGPRVYCQTVSAVVCLACDSGRELWRAARPSPGRRLAYSAPTLVAADDVLLCADRDPGSSDEDRPATEGVEWGVHGWSEPGFSRKGKFSLRAYATNDGAELWSVPCQEGYTSPVDVFVIDNIVWLGPEFRHGLDLKTGQLAREINTKGPRVGMPHHRCYRDKASVRFIFTGKSGVEVLSLDSGWLCNNSWIRGTCQYGILPANGLLYAPPDACACFLTVKTQGFFAAAPQREPTGRMPFPEAPVLERGPLCGQPLAPAGAHSAEWPMYRHDARRSGAAGCKLPDAPKPKWFAQVGGRLTQPVVADGRLLVASIDAHTVHALRAADGQPLWQFTAGGRIDSAPTLYRGRVLFGSADGWVYCLDAADGQLAWRFLAAPAQRLIQAFGQIESLWPVHGSVLVQNDTVYVTAGRSSYLDGGIVLYRLDPATGQQLSRTVLCHLDPDTGEQLVAEERFNMEGTTSDILSGDGERVYLKYFAFDRDGRRTDAERPHLFSIAGLLGEEWFVRNYWIVGQGMPGAGWSFWADAAHRFPFGRILAFNDDTVYGYGRQEVAGGPVGHRADAYHLYRMARVAPPPVPDPRPRRKGGPLPDLKPRPTWSDPESPIVRAMVLAGDRLAIAGPPDLGVKEPDVLAYANAADALAGFEGRKGVLLRIVATADGRAVSQCPLPAMPVFDGLAAAGDRLYLSLKNGSVVCLGAAGP